MPETGVADLDAFIKMKPHEQKLKPIVVGNLDIGLGMFETGVVNLDAFIKMKDVE